MNEEGRLERSAKLAHVLEDCIACRASGKTISDQSLIDAHPMLMPELAEELRRLSVIESGLLLAESRDSVQFGARRRCPDCGNPLGTEAPDSDLTEAKCASCGGTFRVVDDQPGIAPGTTLGRFEVLSKIGEGAFGSVWSARDTKLDRLVAVKVPHSRRLLPREIEQLEREARTSAQLRHPHIVCVHEVGHDGDTVFLVSDLVEGQDLADWLANGPIAPRQAAELCANLANALEHAHEQGVIHRDLKPSNIIVDLDGAPYLTDLGLAKRDGVEPTVTIDGKLLGTPAYMSPEQARGAAHAADRRSDVYSLGVILYEVLTGERPFRGSTRMVLHQILFDDAAGLRRFSSAIPRDLETICLKCLEKAPDRRYQTARELGDDLRRFLRREPIRARPISHVARGARWCRRNFLAASSLGGLAASLLLGFAGTTFMWMRAKEEAERRRRQAYALGTAKIQETWQSGSVDIAWNMLRRHVPRRGEEDLRGFEWYYLWELCRPRLLAKTFEKEPSFGVFAMAVSPDGRYLAAGGAPGTIIIWDIATRRILRRLKGHNYVVRGLAFSPDSRLLASSGGDGRTYLWDVTTAETVAELQGGDNGASFSPDGRLLAVCAGNDVRTWDVSNPSNVRKRTFLPTGTRMWSVAFSPRDPDTLAFGGDDGQISFWSLDSEDPMGPPLHGHTDRVHAVVFSPDGVTLASSGADKGVRLWDVASRTELKHLEGHAGWVTSVAFSRDGNTLASASHDGTVKLWDAKSGELQDTIRAHDFQVWSVAFGPDDKTLLTGSGDGGIRQWDLAKREKPLVLEGNAGFGSAPVAFHPHGKLLAAVRRDSQITVWNLATGAEVATFEGHRERVTDLAFSQDGELVATATNKEVLLWRVDAPGVVRKLDGAGLVAFSPLEENVLATGGRRDGVALIQFWDVSTSQPAESLQVKGVTRLNCLAFSSEGRILACGAQSLGPRNFVLWNARTREEAAAPVGHLGAVDAIAFSPADEVVCTGSFDGSIKLWNSRTGTELDTPIEGRHTSRVRSVAFSPDGKTIASGSRDATIKLWQASTGAHLLTLEGHEASVEDVAFSPDGTMLVSSSGDGTVRIWRAAIHEDLSDVGW